MAAARAKTASARKTAAPPRRGEAAAGGSLKSAVPEIAWPAVPDGQASRLLAVLYQLEQSQWWSPETLAGYQQRQLRKLLAHALGSVPFYRERCETAGLPTDVESLLEGWRELPRLTRPELQEAGDALYSTAVPPAHGKLTPIQTSGSTGRPIRTLATGITKLFWMAFTMRDHLWHGRDFTGTLAAIRPDRAAATTAGKTRPGWGPPVDLMYPSGPSALLNSRTDIAGQARWLVTQNPAYLLTLPSNAQALAEHCISHDVRLPALRSVRTYGEALGTDVRRTCMRAWNVGVEDVYSAQEVGYIALQCPETEHYHLQSENLLIEVLNDGGGPCAPGETGRVVITALHNLASPLIRYEIQDYAEVGESCACGRGLPVIRRILGRQRNMAVRPDGGLFWPSFPAEAWAEIAPLRQVQLVQKTKERIEVRYVMARELSQTEERAFTTSLHGSLGYPFELSFARWAGPILRGPNGKYEDFVCEVAAT